MALNAPKQTNAEATRLRSGNRGRPPLPGCAEAPYTGSSGQSSSSYQFNFTPNRILRGALAFAPTRPKLASSFRLVLGVANWVRFRTLNPSNRTSTVRRCSLDTVKVLAIDTFSLYSGKLRIFGLVRVMLPTWSCGCNGKNPLLVMVAVSPEKLAVVGALK